jgi:nucleoside-diphosphate-sugar epimerase
MSIKGEKILVTGGAGYIGSVLVKELLKQGYGVRVFDKLYFGAGPLNDVIKKIELIQGDVRQFPAKILKGIDAVIHLGSLSNDPTAEFDPKANHEINCLGTLKVAEACKKMGVKRMTFASSAAVYGFHVDSIADETFGTDPQSEYAQSKLDAEKAIIGLAGKDFCPVILRQATVGGLSPRMRWDLVVNTMTKDAFSKGKIHVYCAGDSWRPLVSVKDVAKAHIKCIEAPEKKVKGEIFNLVYKNFRILELAHWLKEALKPALKRDIDIDVQFGKVESRSYRISGRKMKDVLGFEPEHSVEDSALEILSSLQKGKFTDFSNPIYYNIDWMKMLVSMEDKLKVIGKVF